MNHVVTSRFRAGLKWIASVVCLLSLGMTLTHAEDLTLTNGTVYKNITVTKVDPDGLRLIHSDGGGKVLFTDLPETIRTKYHYDPVAAKKYTDEQAAKQKASLDRALQQSAAAAAASAREPEKPAAQTVASAQTTGAAAQPAPRRTPDNILPMVKGDLVYLDGQRFSRFDDSKLSGVRYYAVYYSALWCGPCRQFTPELVRFYNEFKPSHPNFELIFVSMDNDEKGMLEYMQSESMSWPAVEFSAVGLKPCDPFRGTGIRSFAGRGIPDLVLVDAATATVMSDSYVDGKYLGPHKVMNDIKKMVPAE